VVVEWRSRGGGGQGSAFWARRYNTLMLSALAKRKHKAGGRESLEYRRTARQAFTEKLEVYKYHNQMQDTEVWDAAASKHSVP
jgi:hypothetical protein